MAADRVNVNYSPLVQRVDVEMLLEGIALRRDLPPIRDSDPGILFSFHSGW